MIDVTQLGVSGVIVAILLTDRMILWKDNRELRAQMRQDQALAIPALEKSAEALRAVLEEGIRARAIADRERT